MGIVIKLRQHLGLPLLVVCGQWCLLYNQMARFFNHQKLILWKNQVTSQFFCKQLVIKKRQHLRLPLLVRCDQLCLSSNQIAGVFDHQYLWKDLIDLLDFCLQAIIKRRYRSTPSELFLGKGALKICRKFTGEHPCCIFSEHLFLGAPLGGCFCQFKWGSMQI